MSAYLSEKCPQCGADLPAEGEQIVCQYCGSRLIRQPPVGGAATQETAHLMQGVHLKTFTYTDTQGIGIETFRMLIPSGWEFSGGLQWRMNNPGMPAVLAFQVRNPSGYEAFEVFPALSFFWTNDPMSQMLKPRGSLYFGNEVQPPPSGALQALCEMVVPRYRGHLAALELVHQQTLPDLPNQLRVLNPNAPSGMTYAEGAKVRLRYRVEEQSIDEELFGVVQVMRMTVPMLMGMMENIFWSLDYLFSFRALSERLDEMADLFRTMIYSFRINPQWFGRYTQLTQFLIQNQIQQIHQVGQLSRYLSQTQNQISDMIMDSYYQRQQTMDRLADNFSQYLRGVDAYQNPFEDRSVELPSGYQNAWANALGEYILTDDPNFNPNQHSNLNWEPLTRTSSL